MVYGIRGSGGASSHLESISGITFPVVTDDKVLLQLYLHRGALSTTSSFERL